MIPTITAAHVTLRPFQPDDLDAHAAIWSDPRVTAYIGGKLRTREESWLRMLAMQGHWSWFGYGFWAIEADGRLIGNAGFQQFERGLDPELDGPETGWAFAPDQWGQGIATETVAAMMRWADAAGWPRVYATIDPANAASIRVAEKTGFRFERDAVHRQETIRVFVRLAGGAAGA